MRARVLSLTGWQFSRFTMIGLAAAFAYVLIATLLGYALGMTASIASAIAYVTCIPFAYLAQKKLAFRSEHSHSFAFPRYCGVQIVNTILSSVLAAAFARFPVLPGFIVFGMSGALVVGANYLFLSRWAFRPQ